MLRADLGGDGVSSTSRPTTIPTITWCAACAERSRTSTTRCWATCAFRVEEASGFDVGEDEMTLFGLCPACRDVGPASTEAARMSDQSHTHDKPHTHEHTHGDVTHSHPHTSHDHEHVEHEH